MDALLQKEGIAAGAGNQEGGERRQTGVVPQQRLEDFCRTGGLQRIQAQLRVVGLAPPAVLVLGAVIDQEQEPRRRQALDQAIQQGLCFGIDPVQVLKDQQQRLHLAFSDHQALERVQGAPAALRRVERQEGVVVQQGVQQPQQRRDRVLEGRIECQYLPGHLGPDGPRIVVVLDMGIALQQVQHWTIGGGLAIRYGGALEHEPTLGAVGMQALVHQARLAHAGLTERRDHLPPP